MMQSFRKYELILLLQIITFPVVAQLSGNYTIGPNNADYRQVSDALSALKTAGVSGSVVFNIKPGTYSGFTIDSIPNLSYPDSIIFQAETHDSTSVIFSGYSRVIRFSKTKGVTLKWVTITADATKENSAVYFNNSFNCNLINCVLLTPKNIGTTQDDAAIVFERRNYNGNRPINITGCYFMGSGSGIYANYDEGGINIYGNNIASTGRYSITTDYVDYLTLKNNILNGTLDLSFTTGKYFIGNTVNGISDDLSRFTYIENNIFNGAADVEGFIIRGNIFNNNFETSRTIGVTIERNIFNAEVSVSYCNDGQFISNKVMGKSAFPFTDHSRLANNLFYDKVWFPADQSVIFNNLVYAAFENAGYYNRYCYNNFSTNAYLYSQVSALDASYNNFSQPVYAPLSSNIDYNNYYPGKGTYDKHPFFYDPQYDGSFNIRAKNPLLVGKGRPVSFIDLDIDSVERGAWPTIGANEVCISALVNIDSPVITCGDAVRLKLCSIDSNASWSPTNYMDDSTSKFPMVSPTQTTRYYLLDSLGEQIDSILIIVNDFGFHNVPDDSIRCFEMVLLESDFNPSASYDWTPVNGLSDPHSFNPFAYPDTNTLYTLKAEIPGCISFYDTVFVQVNPLPVASGSIYEYQLQVRFYDISLCADNIVWYFGDGQTSTETDATHLYDSAGTYNGFLVAYNSYGTDTFRFSVSLSVGIKDIYTNMLLNIYPNPASTKVALSFGGMRSNDISQVQLFDLLGNEMVNVNLTNNTDGALLNIANIPSGIYMVKATSKTGSTGYTKLIKD